MATASPAESSRSTVINSISSEWGVSENNRKAKFYRLTRAGRKHVEKEATEWEKTTAILARFLRRGEERP
jgi:PadR family transcriptional regulator PadR